MNRECLCCVEMKVGEARVKKRIDAATHPEGRFVKCDEFVCTLHKGTRCGQGRRRDFQFHFACDDQGLKLARQFRAVDFTMPSSLPHF